MTLHALRDISTERSPAIYRSPRLAVCQGHRCDGCGALFIPEIAAVWVEDARRNYEARLCMACMKSLLEQGARIFSPKAAQLQKSLAEITGAEILRADAILGSAAGRIIKRVTHNQITFRRDELVHTFARAIRRECSGIINASRVKPSIVNAGFLEREKRRNDRRDARLELANQLRSARQKLSELNKRINALQERTANYRKKMAGIVERDALALQLARGRERLKRLRDTLLKLAYAAPELFPLREGAIYPDVPIGSIVPTKEGHGLPEAPGIYFFWSGAVIEYIGQSIRISERARLGHEHMEHHFLISFVLIERRELTWAENWYIGTMRPRRNYGGNASHVRYKGNA